MGFADFDIMGKCKKILSRLDLLGEEVEEVLGQTDDTGGTNSSGSVMAKLNKLITDWTATRAGYLDNIRTYTITSNTANATGTLSQKLTYIISTLIGTTGATGGTATAGTVMAKLNKLLKFQTSSFQKTSFKNKASTTGNTELQILTLNNILLYGIYCTIGSSSSSYTITGFATINGVKLQIGPESDYTYGTNLVNNFSSAIGVGFTDPALNNDKSPFTLTEPIFVETLTMSVLSGQTNTNRVWFSGDIYYKQL